MEVPVTTTAADIWRTLSAVNVNEHIERKNGFSYLSWAWAWGVLMQHYPEAEFEFEADANGDEVFVFSDGSCEVRCIITIAGVSRRMWLPVMNHRNDPIKNPHARDINDTRMRCLVKCMALFGLGHYIYAGEDLPSEEKTSRTEDKVAVNPADAMIKAISEAADLDALKAVYTKAVRSAKNRSLGDDVVEALTKAKDRRKEELS